MISTGDPGLDEIFEGGYQSGCLHVVAGGVSSGRTSFLRRAAQIALNAKKSVHIVDLEGIITKRIGRQPWLSGSNVLGDMSDIPVVDLLVLDALHLQQMSSFTAGDGIAGQHHTAMAQWLTNFIPRLRRVALTNNTAVLMSWLIRRDQVSEPRVALPLALAHGADVILRVGEHPQGGFRAIVEKNRFGTNGLESGYDFSVGAPAPIYRRTVWERLTEETP